MRALLLALAFLAPALAGCVGADDESGPVAAFTLTETADGFRFDASPSEGDGLRFTWDLGDGSTADQEVVEHAYAFSNGRVVVQLTVTDADGRTDTAAKDVVKGSGRNTPPTAAMAEAELMARVGEPVRLSAGPSEDPDGGTLSYAWGYVLGAGSASGPSLHEIPAGDTSPLTFEARGVHRYHMHEHPEAEVAIHVEDGAPDAATVQVLADRFEPADPRVAPGGTVEFVNEADAARTLMRLEYVAALTPLPGDVPEMEVTFDKPGTYDVLVTVTDPLGASDTAEATVTVRPQPIVLEEQFTGTLQPGATSAEHALEAPAAGVVWANLTLRSDLPSQHATLTLLANGEPVAQTGPSDALALEAEVPAGALAFRVDGEAGTVLADYVLDVRAVLQP